MSDQTPIMDTIEYTEKLVQSDGTTFNQATYSFNQAGWTFGGLYGEEGEGPNLSE